MIRPRAPRALDYDLDTTNQSGAGGDARAQAKNADKPMFLGTTFRTSLHRKVYDDRVNTFFDHIEAAYRRALSRALPPSGSFVPAHAHRKRCTSRIYGRTAATSALDREAAPQ